MSRSLKFVSLIASELRTATVKPVQGRIYRAAGRLDTGVTVVGIEIGVPWLFRDLKRQPPIVVCSESWMKTGPDWHNGPPMCWVLPDEWRDVMSWKGKPVREIMSEGRQWFLNGVRCLVNRHYSAHLEGISAWPAEWKFWSHYDAGIREYQRERKSATARN